MKITIHQLKDIKNTSYAFYWWLEAEDEFDFNDYAPVYEYESISAEKDDNIFKTLNGVFTTFNLNHPKDFRGHSLSISDIVQVGNRYFYCDDAGWVELDKENFKKFKKPVDFCVNLGYNIIKHVSPNKNN